LKNSIFILKTQNSILFFIFYFKIVSWECFIFVFKNAFKKYFNRRKILFFQNTFC